MDDKIVKNLKLATKIEKKNIDKIINNSKYDVVMFTVDTDYDTSSEHLAKYINKICQRFKSLGVKSVLFTYYDLNEQGLLNYEGSDYKKGDINLFPANTKTALRFKEKLTVILF
jgi:hypothetical protein